MGGLETDVSEPFLDHSVGSYSYIATVVHLHYNLACLRTFPTGWLVILGGKSLMNQVSFRDFLKLLGSFKRKLLGWNVSVSQEIVM